jgi:4-hydroxythreonine-4-phosphate dehydrogenase
MGDPAGIGPEIVLKGLSKLEGRCLLVVGDEELFKKTAHDCHLELPFDKIITSEEEVDAALVNHSKVLLSKKMVNLETFKYGLVSREVGQAAYEALKIATNLTLRGSCDALVTTPLNKESLKAAQIEHIGHTEILGELTASASPVTMFETLGLKIFFMTRHLSLKAACEAVTAERVYASIRECYALSEQFGFNHNLPLAVAALNPHGGDGGLFGDEEQVAIIPAIERSQREGLNVVGPIGADSVFHLAKIGHYRAVLSLYHDQGHIAAKTLDFERTVSVTWNLPFLRTSVDHGTAFDIAGEGRASEVSLLEAIKVAERYLQEEDLK